MLRILEIFQKNNKYYRVLRHRFLIPYTARAVAFHSKTVVLNYLIFFLEPILSTLEDENMIMNDSFSPWSIAATIGIYPKKIQELLNLIILLHLYTCQSPCHTNRSSQYVPSSELPVWLSVNSCAILSPVGSKCSVTEPLCECVLPHFRTWFAIQSLKHFKYSLSARGWKGVF